jgi:hypothetical protein
MDESSEVLGEAVLASACVIDALENKYHNTSNR